MILKGDNKVKCRKCEHKLQCLTTDKTSIVCKKTGKVVELKKGSISLWGN